MRHLPLTLILVLPLYLPLPLMLTLPLTRYVISNSPGPYRPTIRGMTTLASRGEKPRSGDTCRAGLSAVASATADPLSPEPAEGPTADSSFAALAKKEAPKGRQNLARGVSPGLTPGQKRKR